MSMPSFTVNGVTFQFQEGDCESVESNLQGGVQTDAITKTGPMSAFNYDNNGVVKTITLRGFLRLAASTVVGGYSITTILQQKNWLESMLNGNQQSVTFSSTYESSSVDDDSSPTAPYQAHFTGTIVMVSSITFRENNGDPSRLQYTITLVVGQVAS